jgi:hypothetical protein
VTHDRLATRKDDAAQQGAVDSWNESYGILRVFDTHERLHQSPAIRRGEKICHVGGSISRPLSRFTDAECGGRTLEEEWNRHLKNLGKVLQAAGADPVGPLLVFLDLLECQPEGVGNIGLAHIEHETPHSHAADHPVRALR